MSNKANRPARRGNKWRVRWRDAEGGRRSATFDSYREAEAALRRAMTEAEEVRAGRRRPAPPDHTFADLCDQWLELRTPQRRRQDSDHSYIRSALRPAFGHLLVRELRPLHIEAFKVKGTRAGLAPSTVNHHLTLLVSMLRLAAELEWIEKVPRVRKFKVALFDEDFRYLRSADEIRRFLTAAREEREDQARTRAANGGPAIEPLDVFSLYATAIYTGMRLGELAALRWDDVDFKRGLIVVQRSHDGPTKSGAVRYVPILNPLEPILKAWRLRCSGAIVFPNDAGKMRARDDRVFRETLQRVLARAAFPVLERNGRNVHYVTFHCLRHTFASYWMMTGGDIFKLQKILGHKTAAMTQRYAHLAPDVFTADRGRFDDLAVSEGAAIIPLASAR